MYVLRPPAGGGPFRLSRQPLPELIASLQVCTCSAACRRVVCTRLGRLLQSAWLRTLTARRVPPQDTSRQCSHLAGICTTVGASMLLMSLAHRLWVWHRTLKIQRRVERARRDRAAAAAAAAAGSNTATARAEDGSAGSPLQQAVCVVCLERECEMVFRGCGHLCACGSCGAGLRRCPIRRSAGAPIRVYVA